MHTIAKTCLILLSYAAVWWSLRIVIWTEFLFYVRTRWIRLTTGSATGEFTSEREYTLRYNLTKSATGDFNQRTRILITAQLDEFNKMFTTQTDDNTKRLQEATQLYQRWKLQPSRNQPEHSTSLGALFQCNMSGVCAPEGKLTQNE